MRWYLQACPLAGPLFLLIPGQMLLASKGAHTEKCWAVHSVGAGGRGQGLGPSWKTQPVTSCGFAKPRPPLLPRAQTGAGASRLQVRAALRPILGAGARGVCGGCGRGQEPWLEAEWPPLLLPSSPVCFQPSCPPRWPLRSRGSGPRCWWAVTQRGILGPPRSGPELVRQTEPEPGVWTESVYYHVDTDTAVRGRT